ncbi:hypothetical protein A2819_00285 [Candidatus Azambacteria bacterium RIFCSPHIGHO2_01_FULL_40_24]|uniref:Glycosyltransferase RgtA/B/C/D-like domain-containing protein n=1 Tax=Candidatus Azambacteria bacterium RIFCSPHIGHO2_01_FULL_40_24 TaxID=1797301 RepID=A0A1F5B3Y4_9BACT|nr:MAG: hypothetical protein A2819_00285 [Candidatus Azambacteria bacterium RIFCSPHIGHO2_01_FULL_40_24]
MKNFIVLHKKPILIFTITLLVELLVIFILIRINGTEIFFRGDGQDYQNLANNLINHQMLAITPLPPYWPTSFRTPIYPFWLAFIYLIFRSYNAAIFIGAFVFALSAPLIYLIGREVFTEKVAVTAAFLSGLEPWALFQAGFIAAEQIFMPIFLLSAYFLCLYLKYSKTSHIYFSSFIMGIAVLTRPAALFFIAIFIFLALIFESKYSFWRSIKVSVLIFFIFIAVLAPWLVRNKVVLNSWQFSSASGIRSFADNVMLQEYLGKTKPGEAIDIYKQARQLVGAKSDYDLMTVENSQKISQIALKEIKTNFGAFLKMHFKDMSLFLFKNSYGNIFFDLGVPDSNVQSKISNYIQWSEIKYLDIINLIKNSSSGAKILLVLVFFWPAAAILAVMGIFTAFKQNRYNLLFWFLILWIIYFPFLVSWGDISRYRLSIHASLFLLTAAGFYRIKSSFLTLTVKND